jgi:hypothetical protein
MRRLVDALRQQLLWNGMIYDCRGHATGSEREPALHPRVGTQFAFNPHDRNGWSESFGGGRSRSGWPRALSCEHFALSSTRALASIELYARFAVAADDGACIACRREVAVKSESANNSLISFDRFVRNSARGRGDGSMHQAGSMNSNIGKRHRRMPINSAVLMLRGDESWTSELMDISATGVMVRRPVDWIGQRGDRFVLDMLFGDELNIHVEARVARVTEDEVGFAFSQIPSDKEAPLWNLLGGYADSLEIWTD